MDEIMHIVDTKKRQVKPLTEDETRVLDLVLCGSSPPQAYIEVYNLTYKDKPEYHRIAAKANSFLKTIRAQRYLIAHRKQVRIIVEQDMEALAAHIYDIAMGNNKKEVAHYDREDGWVHTEVSPSHSDQIAAAAWVKSWYDDKRKTQLLNITDEENRKQEEVRGKAEEFLKMFSGNKVIDGTYTMKPNVAEELDAREIYLETESVEVKPDVVKSMISSFTDGDDDVAEKIMVNYASRTED